MSRRLWVGVLLGAAGLGLVFWLWPRKAFSARDLIEQHCIRMVRAAEEREVPEMMDRISERFHSTDGMGKPELKGLFLRELLHPTWVRVFMTDLDVQVRSPSQAEVRAKFVFGSSKATSLRELAKESVMNAFAVEAEFTREADGEWRVTGERHRPLNPDELLTLQ